MPYQLVALALSGALVYALFALPRVRVAGIPEGFAEKQFRTGEVTLNYVEGPRRGVPLLLIPGQMESWQGYKPVLADLAKRFHVFAVDLRGHGKSSRTPGCYSYNSCGGDLKQFLEGVIGEPALVSGLSSGAVLAVWLGAYAPACVRAVIAEDPPMFSSLWPRIRDEKFMAYNFQSAVDALGGPGPRDLDAVFSRMGIPNPKEGQQDALLLIPRPIAKGIVGLYKINRRLRPGRPYDAPFLPFSIRAGFKFYLEYDTDFSVATLDGRLSAGFDPDDALRRVGCPMLLLHATWSRHPTWGLLGAMDDADAQRMRALVADLTYVPVRSGHTMHMSKPKLYLERVLRFVDERRLDEPLRYPLPAG
jgi:pimeloyl-ACP methyl ester carboxylesterase